MDVSCAYMLLCQRFFFSFLDAILHPCLGAKHFIVLPFLLNQVLNKFREYKRVPQTCLPSTIDSFIPSSVLKGRDTSYRQQLHHPPSSRYSLPPPPPPHPHSHLQLYPHPYLSHSDDQFHGNHPSSPGRSINRRRNGYNHQLIDPDQEDKHELCPNSEDEAEEREYQAKKQARREKRQLKAQLKEEKVQERIRRKESKKAEKELGKCKERSTTISDEGQM